MHGPAQYLSAGRESPEKGSERDPAHYLTCSPSYPVQDMEPPP
jgi:hypothetical protein